MSSPQKFKFSHYLFTPMLMEGRTEFLSPWKLSGATQQDRVDSILLHNWSRWRPDLNMNETTEKKITLNGFIKLFQVNPHLWQSQVPKLIRKDAINTLDTRLRSCTHFRCRCSLTLLALQLKWRFQLQKKCVNYIFSSQFWILPGSFCCFFSFFALWDRTGRATWHHFSPRPDEEKKKAPLRNMKCTTNSSSQDTHQQDTWEFA